MPRVSGRKTATMRLLERLHPGQEIEEIVDSVWRSAVTPEAAAVSLGVSLKTLREWRKELGLDEERQPVGVL